MRHKLYVIAEVGQEVILISKSGDRYPGKVIDRNGDHYTVESDIPNGTIIGIMNLNYEAQDPYSCDKPPYFHYPPRCN
jgi:hypothetical protein